MNENIARKQIQVNRSKAKIVDAYLSLMLEKKWDSIHIKEISERAGISRGTFYQHFTDIYEVMEYAQSSVLDELSATLLAAKPTPIPSVDKLKEDFDNQFPLDIPPLFIIWFSFCESHKKELLSLAHLYNGDLYFPRRVRSVIRPHLNAMMDKEGLPYDEFREHFHQYFFNVMYYVMYGWISEETPIKMTAEMMAEVLNATRIGSATFYYKKRMTGEYGGNGSK